MKTICLVAALVLLPSFASEAAAHVRVNKSIHRAHLGTQPAVDNRLRGSGIEGRQIAAPPWSFACTNDTGPQRCDEPMWIYGSPDYVAQFKSAF
jgi:hypothetical protein